MSQTYLALQALGVLAAFLLAYVLFGLFQARSLVRREFAAYFVSPIAYVVMVVFLAVTGYLYAGTFQLLTATGPRGTEYPWRSMFADERFWLVFLVIPPLLTMRLFAEERSSGTLEPLMTAPLHDWQVVLGKYAACLAFYVVLWLPTLAYVPALQIAHEPLPASDFSFTPWSLGFLAGLGLAIVGLVLLVPRLGTTGRLVSVLLFAGGVGLAIAAGVMHFGHDEQKLVAIPVGIDPYPALSTYLGLLLAGAMFLALGIFVSSLVRDQLVAAILAMALGLPFILAGFFRPEAQGTLASQVVYYLSVPLHFDRAFTRGIVDTRPLVLYGSVTLFCLFLTVRSLESRRWQ
ncbi:MAG: ABC transporter permease [Gemmataceae bacterium]|nr:ABC transporter permease [Gemmataceae bacterium]